MTRSKILVGAVALGASCMALAADFTLVGDGTAAKVAAKYGIEQNALILK